MKDEEFRNPKVEFQSIWVKNNGISKSKAKIQIQNLLPFAFAQKKRLLVLSKGGYTFWCRKWKCPNCLKFYTCLYGAFHLAGDFCKSFVVASFRDIITTCFNFPLYPTVGHFHFAIGSWQLLASIFWMSHFVPHFYSFCRKLSSRFSVGRHWY